MKVLLWHVDKFIVDVREKAIPSPPPVKEKHFEMGEGVVALITLEKGDDERKEEIFKNILDGLKDYLEKVKANTLLLYPYAHLSNDLLPLSKSLRLFEELVNYIKDTMEGISVFSSPFGWYKAFEVRVKGHPLSELSRKY